MKKKMYFLCFVVISLIACNQQKTNTNTPSSPKTPTVSTPSVDEDIPTQSTAPDITALVQEKPLTEYAKQFYTNLLWHYEAAVVVNNPEKAKSYTGKWIKFNPDNTLETAFYDGTVTLGRWVIDEEKNILTLLEGGERPTLSQWTVKSSSSSDAIMILVGTKKYANNSTQIKMIRYSGIPLKDVQ